MHPIEVESTTLARIAYDAQEQLLDLQFRDRAIYRYFEVPAIVHAELMTARSKGEYFNRAIRGHFRHDRLKAPSTKTPSLGSIRLPFSLS
jgi:lysyl-tRNA synthetase class 2